MDRKAAPATSVWFRIIAPHNFYFRPYSGVKPKIHPAGQEGAWNRLCLEQEPYKCEQCRSNANNTVQMRAIPWKSGASAPRNGAETCRALAPVVAIFPRPTELEEGTASHAVPVKFP